MEKGVPSVTPRLEKDMSPKLNGDPSVPLVARLIVVTAANVTTRLLLVLCSHNSGDLLSKEKAAYCVR